MNKTTFRIAKMDCPSEENLLRMQLDELKAVKSLHFDIPQRRLVVVHQGELDKIEKAIGALKLDSSIVKTEQATDNEAKLPSADEQKQRKLLWAVLIINFAFFVIEITTGFLSDSMGLVADSLDMLADALVYGLSLFAIGHAARKKRTARISGYLQLTLAAIGLAEIIRRFVGMEELPDFQTMIIVSAFALLANATSLYLLQKSKSQEAHMQASMIFTSNDIIINLGVILAGVLVFVTSSKLPDLIIGAIVFVIVTRGAIRILKLGR
ncbi:MAG: cation transporter [Cyclobacteriaceae bacterium]